jgi:hypothetical protein
VARESMLFGTIFGDLVFDANMKVQVR